MKLTFFILCIGLLPSLSFSKVDEKSCDFYVERNKIFPCPKEVNYLQEYGLKYCHKFSELEKDTQATTSLKSWITGTKNCLQEMIDDNPKRYLKDCSQLSEFSFDVHPICYKQYGICKLSPREIIKISKIVINSDFIDDFEKNKRATVLQMTNVMAACLANNEAISKSGETFYQLVLRDSVRLRISVVSKLLEIIDYAPVAYENMEKFFSKLLSKKASTEGKQVSGESISRLAMKDAFQLGSSNRFDISNAVGTNVEAREKAQIYRSLNEPITDQEAIELYKEAKRLAGGSVQR